MKYQELTLIPSSEISMNMLWERVMQQIHIGLVDIYNQHGVDTIGLCFPEYYMELRGPLNGLGAKLRLIAPDEMTLNLLNIKERLNRLQDYIHLKSILPIPEDTYPVKVSRYRFQPIEKQAENLSKKVNISFQEALSHCRKYRRKEIFPPFIRMKSLSTDRPFPLVILQEKASVEKKGGYTTYGLSRAGSTVPMW